MHWEKLSVSFVISVDVPEVVYQSMKKELTNAPGFQWQAYNQAANHCISNGIHLEEAAVWVKKSLEMQQNFTNLITQSRLLEKQGKSEEAAAAKKQAFSIADESQLNTYGYELLAQGITAEALEIFKLNVARYPKSWNVYDSLGEVLEMMGDTKGAISNYKIAFSKAPDVQRKRIAPILSRLEGK
jgi:tetratricopeptide (TPR) repeat protein